MFVVCLCMPHMQYVGENLAADTTNSLDAVIDRSLTAFFEEHRDYNFRTLHCTPGKMCGHYTQVRMMSPDQSATSIRQQ